MSSTEAAMLRYMMQQRGLRPAVNMTHADVAPMPVGQPRQMPSGYPLSAAGPPIRPYEGPKTYAPGPDRIMPDIENERPTIPAGPGAMMNTPMNPAVNQLPVQGRGMPRSTNLPVATTMRPPGLPAPMPSVGRSGTSGIPQPQQMYQTLVAR